MKYTLKKFHLNCIFKTRSCRRRCHYLNHVLTALVAVFVQLKYGRPDQRSLLFPNRDSLDRHCQAGQTRISLQHASDSLVVAVTFDVDRNAVDTASPTVNPPLPTPAPTTPSPTGNQTQPQTSRLHTTGSVHITAKSNLEVYVCGFRLTQIFRNHVHL